MSDSLLTTFIKKLDDLEKLAYKQGAREIVPEIAKIKQWLVGDRSIIQHRCCQAFMTYLYNSYGDDFTSREDYIDWLKYHAGFCKVKITEAVIDGEKVIFKKFKPQSLSFAQCSHKKHNAFFEKIQEFAFAKYGLKFEDWYREYQKNEALI